jgi:hypothetical protein
MRARVKYRNIIFYCATNAIKALHGWRASAPNGPTIWMMCDRTSILWRTENPLIQRDEVYLASRAAYGRNQVARTSVRGRTD